MTKNSHDAGPIFLVGMNGSGTTMMADCLNNHPMIFVPRYESKIIPYYYSNLAEYGDLNLYRNFNNLLIEFSNIHIFRNLNRNAEPVKINYDFDNIDNKNLSGIIDLTFSHFARKQGKRIWGDHSPKYAICLDILVDLFPNCKIIHMIRDARDCALSLSRRFNTNMSRTAFQWKNIVQTACRGGSRLGAKRYYEIRYEDLTSDPDRHMRFLFDFLELPFDRIVLKSKMPMFQKTNMAQACTNTIVPNSGKWKSGLSADQTRRIEAIAGKTLKRLNYEIEWVAGDLDIPPFRLFCIKSLGKINGVYLIIKNAKIRKLIPRLWRVALSSLKQMRYFKY